MGNNSRRLILASASPRRRELLSGLGIGFEVVVAGAEERDELRDGRELVARNAAVKADWVAERNRDALVIGADTTVVLEGRVLVKPRDLEEAREMLRMLSGKVHEVFTGVSGRCVESGFREDVLVETRVRFLVLTEEVIERYLGLVNVLDKAGGYAVQEQGELIVAGVEGSFSNVVGLPMEVMRGMLERGGVELPLGGMRVC